MLRKCTDEDISDEECEKVINPFYDNYDSYLEEYVVPEVIAFYIASSFYFIMILEVANMNKIEMRKVLANNLVALLDYKKISRKNIADDLKLSYTKVCDWTRARTYPSDIELGKLANYLETTVEQLTDGNSLINDSGFEPEQSSKKAKISVIDIGSEEWIIHPVDYEWVSTKYLTPETGYLMFDVVDDLMKPKYDIGDTVLVEFLNNKSIKEDGDYLVKLKEYDSWLFIHIYVKKDGYLVAPLNNNNSKSILPRFYTKKEFTESATQPHKAIRVSKNI